eukprot:gene21952-15961_t
MSSALLLVLVSAPCVTSRVFDDTASFYTPNRPLWTGRPMFSFPPAAVAGGATGGGVPTAIVSGASVDVWGAVNTLHRCGSYIASVPDIPARAYDDNDGVTHMIVGSTSYHHMNGSSILNVTRECAPTWNATLDPNPAHFAGDEFLDSPIAFENGTVVALVHTEYPGGVYNST